MKQFNKIAKHFIFSLFAAFTFANIAFSQAFISDIRRDSARSDKLTGGVIEKTTLIEGAGNLRITINVPAFQMTLWQNGKEVKTYPVGLGLLDYPIYIGKREASQISWNPVWIPPSSDWVEASSTVKPGEIILPTDPRNPLGKVKIPLGYGYLIHQAKGAKDLGNLVSHGCVRVMQKDLYDLADKIVVGRALDVSNEQIATAKTSLETLTVDLDPIIPVEITYDTLVIEDGKLHIYPDVYNHRKNTVANLREELRSNGIEPDNFSDATLQKMLNFAVSKKQFVVNVAAIENGTALKLGKTIAVLPNQATPKAPVKKRAKR